MKRLKVNLSIIDKRNERVLNTDRGRTINNVFSMVEKFRYFARNNRDCKSRKLGNGVTSKCLRLSKFRT